jgi:putative oxidoreductase
MMKKLHVGLWVAQVLLAAMFGAGGFWRATAPMDQITANIHWASAVPEALLRFTGWAELLGAIGLILPSATRILPKLTVLAALGLLLVMILAAGFHLMRSEFFEIWVNLCIGALAAFVAWGRSKKVPIQPRASAPS